MIIFDFTVEETNLVAIYKADTRAATLARIVAALSDMDADFTPIAEGAVTKLRAMSDNDFDAEMFSLTDEDEGEDYA
jgi:hypothetical protein